MPEKVLIDHLKACKWDVNNAMGAWYDNHMDTKYPIPKGSSFGGGNSKCDEKNVLAFFNKFKDEVAPAPKGFP